MILTASTQSTGGSSWRLGLGDPTLGDEIDLDRGTRCPKEDGVAVATGLASTLDEMANRQTDPAFDVRGTVVLRIALNEALGSLTRHVSSLPVGNVLLARGGFLVRYEPIPDAIFGQGFRLLDLCKSLRELRKLRITAKFLVEFG
jgi:hypothetical protein